MYFRTFKIVLIIIIPQDLYRVCLQINVYMPICIWLQGRTDVRHVAVSTSTRVAGTSIANTSAVRPLHSYARSARTAPSRRVLSRYTQQANIISSRPLTQQTVLRYLHFQHKNFLSQVYNFTDYSKFCEFNHIMFHIQFIFKFD